MPPEAIEVRRLGRVHLHRRPIAETTTPPPSDPGCYYKLSDRQACLSTVFLALAKSVLKDYSPDSALESTPVAMDSFRATATRCSFESGKPEKSNRSAYCRGFSATHSRSWRGSDVELIATIFSLVESIAIRRVSQPSPFFTRQKVCPLRS